MRKVAFGRPIIGEEEKRAVMEVLGGDILVHGPRAKDFEASFKDFTGSPFAVSVSSCTAALHLSYFYLGLGPGDEVIVPAQTHNATAHAVELCRATPVFVDAEITTGNIDIDQIESKITSRTKAISIVHFLGMPVDMKRVVQIAKKHGLFVVEDCALAMGTYLDGIHAGLHGDVGCFSYYPVKHMTTGEGGILSTTRGEIAEKITRQKAFGVDRTVSERQVPGVYDVTMLGFNYRMGEINAAIGIEQLKKMPSFLKIRKENYEALESELKKIPEVGLFQSTNGRFQSSYYCLSLLLDKKIAPKRFELVKFLNERGVGTSVYYPHPVPCLSYYKEKYGGVASDYPNASRISYESIALPVAQHLNLDDMKYIVQVLKDGISEIR